MKNKFEAVQITNPAKDGTGYEVRTKVRGMWYTVCDTWCVDGVGDAKETAEKIAALLNKADKGTERVVVKIKDCDGEAYADHDLFFNAPAGMNEKKAVQLVNKTIRKVQKNKDYIFEDLELALCELGFDQTSFAVADERW
jgi:hypothetical protein